MEGCLDEKAGLRAIRNINYPDRRICMKIAYKYNVMKGDMIKTVTIRKMVNCLGLPDFRVYHKRSQQGNGTLIYLLR